MQGVLKPNCFLRFCKISGYDNRTNDIVYCPPKIIKESSSAVVYFGGDVQDFLENMQSHADNKNYIKWNLEAAACILQNRFLDSHIVVVRPVRTTFKTFSCFENFVPGNKYGAPEHTPMHYALCHLKSLLQRLSQKLDSLNTSSVFASSLVYSTSFDTKQNESIEKEFRKSSIFEDQIVKYYKLWQKNHNLENDLILIGFSKGCVVLNQFLYEFHSAKMTASDDNATIQRIKEMYWLDGGHSGCNNTWITSHSLIETFVSLGIQVYVHVTPYQINDDRRPWIGKEEKMFSDLLRNLGGSIIRTVHFENAIPNLMTHFEVLVVFKNTI